MIGDRRWRVWLTVTAEGDFRNIFRWTAQRFGHAQARIHGETLTHAIQALTDGPYVAGSRQRDEISKGFMTLHVARVGRRGGTSCRIGLPARRSHPPSTCFACCTIQRIWFATWDQPGTTALEGVIPLSRRFGALAMELSRSDGFGDSRVTVHHTGELAFTNPRPTDAESL